MTPVNALRQPVDLTNPFKGPVPLETGDPIFGRERELDELLAQLVVNRLVLLHSFSGCGKTSLIDAGLRPRLHEHRLRGLPTIRMPRRTGSGRVDADVLLKPVLEVVEGNVSPVGVANQTGETGQPTTDTGSHGRHKFGRQPRPFDLLIFDQLEEVLDVAHVAETDRLEFFRYVGNMLKERTRWALFAIREDYLGALEPYLRFFPTYLSSRFRLTQLDVPNATQAILSLCEKSGIVFQPEAAKRLALDLASTDAENASESDSDRHVEPVYLQVAGRYVWETCHQQGRVDITVEDVRAVAPSIGPSSSLAPVEVALQRYYDHAVAAATDRLEAESTAAECVVRFQSGANDDANAMDTGIGELQERVRDWFSDELIAYTPQGEQRRQTLFTKQSAIDQKTLRQLEDTYIIRKDVRNGIWYELAHDRLVQPVLRSNLAVRRWFRQPWQQAAETWAQEEEDRAFLVLRGALLKEALDWASKNPERVSASDQKFLEECVREAQDRRKLKRYRRIAVAAVAVAAVFAAIVSLATARWLSDASRDVQRSERIAADSRKQAEKSRLDAASFVAQARVAQTALQIRQNEFLVMQAKLDAVTARESAALRNARGQQRLADLAFAETRAARAETDKQKVELERLEHQSAELVKKAQAEVGALNTITQAYDLLSQARRSLALDNAVAAAKKLSGIFAAQWNAQARQALQESLATIEELSSRTLVAGSVQTEAPVLGVGLNGELDCIHYIAANGLFATRITAAGKPCPDSTKNDRPRKGLISVRSRAISEDAAVVALGSGRGEIAVTMNSGKDPREPFDAYVSEVMTSYVSRTGKYLATASARWSFEVSDLRTWPSTKKAPRKLLRFPIMRWWTLFFPILPSVLLSDAVYSINAFAIDEGGTTIGGQGPLLATGRRFGTIEFYDVMKKRWLLSIPGETGRGGAMPAYDKAPTALAFDARGVTFASGGVDGQVLLWPLPPTIDAWRAARMSGQASGAAVLPGCKAPMGNRPGGSVTAVAFSPDDRILAVACQTGSVLLYYVPSEFDATTVIPSESILTLVGQPSAMVFHRTRRRLIVGGSSARLEEFYVPTEAAMRERHDIAKGLAAARESASKGEALDTAAVSSTLAKIETKAPGSGDSWEAPLPRRSIYWK